MKKNIKQIYVAYDKYKKANDEKTMRFGAVSATVLEINEDKVYTISLEFVHYGQFERKTLEEGELVVE